MKCQDCTKRHLHCHSTCEDYLQWKRELEERKAKIQKAKEEEDNYISYYADVIEKYKKRRNKR